MWFNRQRGSLLSASALLCSAPGLYSIAGLEITAGQRTMSELIWELTGQPFVLPVMLTGHI